MRRYRGGAGCRSAHGSGGHHAARPRPRRRRHPRTGADARADAQGDRWCVCAGRWQQALDAGVAPRVVLSATSRAVLDSLFLDDLTRHAVDPSRQSSSSRVP
ncbi:DUF2237 family protein [Thiomonas sp.]|uniref:DUF2237 family protein n=1 Tax=Thiomonas sp. TaxID=2047785 RepID=UPI00262E4CBD|nr:DUF2237 family protein [Thiomonas sp.]